MSSSLPHQKQNDTLPFWSFSLEEIYRQTHGKPNGLTTDEASERLKSSPAKKEIPSWQKDFLLFFRQFKSPLVLMLVVAVTLSILIGEKSDAAIILFILLATGLLGFFQERNAGRTVEKLQAMIAVKSHVLRDGKEVEAYSKDIVAGDILSIHAGDIVPADCYIIEANELYVNEASLTGESFPVRKEPGQLGAETVLAHRMNCLWKGSNIASGSGKAIVVKTGHQTVFGGITSGASSMTETAFEKGIRHFGFFLLEVTLVLAFAILAVNLFFHKPLVESLLFALALAVGMAPELLPAINTIAMSAGAKRMLQKKVIVKKLSAIQNLGEVNLLCTDKTGTITQGNIQLAAVNDALGNESPSVKQLAFLNACYESGYSNPIDEVLKNLPLTIAAGCSKGGEIPYDFIRKRLTIAVKQDDKLLVIAKGAFKNILEICSQVRMRDQSTAPLEDCRDDLEKLYRQYGQDGFRVLGICYKELQQTDISRQDEKEMLFAGFILLEDPLKEGLDIALASLKDLQVGIKIITGDNKIVAECIGRKIGLKEPVILSGDEMRQMSPEALVRKAKETNIFAEVEPLQKEAIIRALRKNFTVAYMGDGINDVTAINAADVGISIDNAVDVARAAADFVLLERDLCVLADGIKEGRKTFNNTLKYILINTGATFGNMFSVAVASLMLPFLPMLPAQILLTNFISGLPFLAISTDNVDKDVLKQNARWDIRLIRKYMVVFGLHSSLFDIITFLTLFYVLKSGETEFQTAWFLESVLTELLILFVMRTRKPFYKSRPSNLLLGLSIAAFIVILLLIFWPGGNAFGLCRPGSTVFFAMMLIVLAYLVTADLLKLWFFKRMARERAAN
jgi:Mg2+-importing ATPase